MLDRQLIQEKYTELKSYQGVATFLGVSRQRIHQILTGYKTIDKDLGRKRHKKSRAAFIDWLRMQPCNRCKGISQAIHHLDNNSKNNSSENLIAVCRKCHGLLHRGKLHKSKYRGKICRGWCQRILGVAIDHQSYGYCSGCYNAKVHGRVWKGKGNNAATICKYCGKDIKKNEIKGFLRKGYCNTDYTRLKRHGMI